MKQRLFALDGLRGFAAISVVISHIGFNLDYILQIPIIHYLFRIISAGTTAVQLFFVLSGFLMAYLYPVISNSLNFIGKRYLRIIPVYGVVVIYIWWIKFHGYVFDWQYLAALLTISFLVYCVWQLAAWLKNYFPKIGKLILITYLVFQALWLIFILTGAQKLLAGALGPLSNYQRQTLFMLSNLTMTMYLLKQLAVFSGVFWSLVPEMMFYLIYPFVVIPLIKLMSKQGLGISLALTAIIIKILFDFDLASRAFFSLHGIFISRASGFVVGAWIGTAFLNKGKLWRRIEEKLRQPMINLIILAVFFGALSFEWPDKVYQVRQYVMYHFLGLSLIFGLVVAAAISSGSWISRLFGNKVLIFLGTISYSLYLIHPQVIDKIKWLFLGWPDVIRGLMLILICIGVAWLLFWMIERLYFITKKTATDEEKPRLLSKPSKIKIGLISIAIGIIVIMFYAGDYSFSLKMAKQAFPKMSPFKELLITPNQPLRFEFSAKQPNLSVVLLSLDYVRDPGIMRVQGLGEIQLVFKLYDSQNKLIFESQRNPQELEGEPQFPFGFPVIADSKGKKYFVELSLINANISDQIYLYKDSGIVSQYLTEKNLSLNYLTGLMWQRLMFVFSYKEAILALGFIGLMGLMTVIDVRKNS